jgi:hypothetical protein
MHTGTDSWGTPGIGDTGGGTGTDTVGGYKHMDEYKAQSATTGTGTGTGTSFEHWQVCHSPLALAHVQRRGATDGKNGSPAALLTKTLALTLALKLVQ